MSRTEVTVSTGRQYEVAGTPHDVEASILRAARGSIMELAWLTDADSGQDIGINPDHVVALRELPPESSGPGTS